MTIEKIERPGMGGDVWTYVAIDAQTKLVISWLVGRRDAGCAMDFLQDVAACRITSKLTTDGHKRYLAAVPDAFGEQIDYAQLVKVYGHDPEGEKRLQPGAMAGIGKDRPSR